MNITRIHAENFRSYVELDVELPHGCLAICGLNGSGKSSLVETIPLALFGPEGRSLAPYLNDESEGQNLMVEVELEHAGAEYRIRRTYSDRGRGQTKVDFECRNNGTWEPRTMETAAATQEEIERVIGLSRETFGASAFLSQGRGAAFTEAQPRERKAILAEVLGLGSWDRLLEVCRVDKRKTEREATELSGRISLLEESGDHAAELEASRSRLHSLVSDLEGEHAAGTAKLDAAAVAVQELERAEATYRQSASNLLAAEARLHERQAVIDRAAAAKLEAVAVQRELGELTSLLDVQKAILEEQRTRDIVSNTEALIREHNALRLVVEGAVLKRNDLLGRASALNEQARDLRLAGERVVLAHVGDARCDLCQQVLGREAAEATAKRHREQAETFDYSAAELDKQAAAVEIGSLDDPPQRDPLADTRWAAAQAKLERARNDHAQRVRLEERLAGFQATIAEATPELLDEVARLAAEAYDARKMLAAIDEPEPGALDAAQLAAATAKAQLDIVAHRLTESRTALIRAESALEAAQKVAAELLHSQLRRDELQAELDVLVLLERAYGRDGIPALIVESSAIPSIETEASRILAELGTSYRVELRTQKALKSGDGLADTLDVVVIGDAGERSYETFSGGERTRINLALRIALARLLAHRRGAESRLLAIDEPDGLDSPGFAALATILNGMHDDFDKVVVVTHQTELQDAFDQVLRVEKIDGRSQAVMA